MADPETRGRQENPELTVLVLLRKKTRCKKFGGNSFLVWGGYRIQNDTNIQPLRHDKAIFVAKKNSVCVCHLQLDFLLMGVWGVAPAFWKLRGWSWRSRVVFSLFFFLLDAEVFKVTSDEKSRLRAFSESQNVIFVLKIPLKPMSQEGDFFPCETWGLKSVATRVITLGSTHEL